MPVNLRNRSFLKEIDFTPEELRFLLKLSADLKEAKATGTEQPRLRGRNIALIFEKTSTRTRCAFEVAAFDQGAHVTYLDPRQLADGAQGIGGGHGARAGPLLRRHRVPRQGAGRRGGAGAVLRRARLQRPHRRVAPHPDAGRLPDHARGQRQGVPRALVRLHGRPALQHGPLAAGHGRAHGQRRAPGRAEGAGAAAGRGRRSPGTSRPRTGARITITDDAAKGVKGVDFIHTDVWVSMGEPKEVWKDRVKLLKAYQVNAGLMKKSGNPDVRFMHCLPAFHDANTVVGKEMMEATGMPDGLEVSDEVFGRRPASSSTRPRTACTPSRPSWWPRWRPCACRRVAGAERPPMALPDDGPTRPPIDRSRAEPILSRGTGERLLHDAEGHEVLRGQSALVVRPHELGVSCAASR